MSQSLNPRQLKIAQYNARIMDGFATLMGAKEQIVCLAVSYRTLPDGSLDVGWMAPAELSNPETILTFLEALTEKIRVGKFTEYDPHTGDVKGQTPQKVYFGRRLTNRVEVLVYGERGLPHPLAVRLDVLSHSPDGFEWGYSGSGPAQLALALLVDVLDDEDEAIRLHQEFKFRVVSGLNRECWQLTREEILATVEQIRESPQK